MPTKLEILENKIKKIACNQLTRILKRNLLKNGFKSLKTK